MDFSSIVLVIIQFVLLALLIIVAGAFVYAFFAAVVLELKIYTDKLKARRKSVAKFEEDHQS